MKFLRSLRSGGSPRARTPAEPDAAAPTDSASLDVGVDTPTVATSWVLEGTIEQGREHPGRWIELEQPGNVVFELSFSAEIPLEIVFADAGGTWFQVPPMDPLSGAVALPLEAGRYYLQVRDPGDRGAAYRLAIWPPAHVATLGTASPPTTVSPPAHAAEDGDGALAA